MFTYVNFKAEVQFIRSKLKEECPKTQLGELIIAIDKYESQLKQEYESLCAMITPSQDIRRRMDTCTSVTTEIIALLKRRHTEAGTKEFDAEAVKETLLQLPQREDARSVYGSTVSRAGRGNQQGSHVSVKKAEAAARLASKCAEMNREKEISAQRKEVLAQQERLKFTQWSTCFKKKNFLTGQQPAGTGMSLKHWMKGSHIQVSRNFLTLWQRRHALHAIRFPLFMH